MSVVGLSRFGDISQGQKDELRGRFDLVSGANTTQKKNHLRSSQS
jgi:hypothetical protein